MIKLNKVLLIDDDTINNYVNEKLLKKLDIASKIEVFLNGEEAIADITESGEVPELVFLDINMPVSNGFEFLKNLKILKLVNHRMIIIILTNEVKPGDLEKLNYFGINELLTKPLTEEKLNYILEKYFLQVLD